MVGVGLLQSVQAFQSALRLRLAGEDAEPILKFYAGLTEASFLVRCALDARVLEEACSRLDIHPRSILGREVRPSFLLEASRPHDVEIVLTESLHTRPASLLIRLMGEYPEATLSVLRPDGRRRKCMSSVISLMSLVLREGERVTFEAEGKGARAMLVRLKKINAGGWKRWNMAEELKTPPVLPFTDTLTLLGITNAADKAMREFGVGELCGVFDPEAKHLHFGRPEWGHGGTALAAGLRPGIEYGRINFTKTADGEIRAYFPAAVLLGSVRGYVMLAEILGTILA